jgi:hypothetical protein
VPCFKPIILSPLTGPLDVRSSPDLIPMGAFRWHQNFQTTERGRLCRRPGFERFLKASSYNNQDLHDQMLNAQIYLDGSGDPQVRSAGREAITLLQPVDSLAGWRTLFAASHSRIYELVESTGNWRILGDGFGGPASSPQYFDAASLGNTTIFTNNFDKPQSYVLGDTVSGSDLRRTRDIADLDTIGISAAKIVVQFMGVMVLMNVVADGSRRAMRIVWSGYLQPLSWVPGTNSIAGFQDLDYDEEILAAAPLQGALMIYTNKGIWRMSVSESVFSFKQVYVERRSRDKCLAYPRTLVSTGFTHFFLSRTGIYEWNGFLTEPERVAWLHLGSGTIFDDIDTSCCEAPVAEYRPETKEVYVSWPQPGQGCINTRTFIFSPEFQSSDILDQGFTAFTNYTSDNQILLRDWLSQYCLCSPAVLEQTAGNFTKEGGSTNSCGGYICPQPFTPTSLVSNENPVDLDGREIENSAEDAAADSLCALLSGLELSDWCAPCSTAPLFVGAASSDLCLKQFTPSVFSREFCTNPSDEGAFPANQNDAYCSVAGEYELLGYYSLLRGIFPFGKNDNEKVVNNALIEGEPEEQAVPCSIRLRLGTSYRAVDPNTGLVSDYGISEIDSFPSGKSCPLWQQPYEKLFESPDSVTMEEMRANNWDPNEALQWPVFEKGRFIHFEIAICNQDGSPALGGAGCLSALHLWTQVEAGC